jgi:hypothetical protein
MGGSNFFWRYIFIFGQSTKILYEKVGECAMEAIKTFLSGKRQGGGGGEE